MDIDTINAMIARYEMYACEDPRETAYVMAKLAELHAKRVASMDAVAKAAAHMAYVQRFIAECMEATARAASTEA